ncbi:MAG TPA: cytochrome c biogenesis protein CcdA [Alphaproteobacteria bacterium]|nr:cytochrome c biogenesis protein CcdA [Alphaproteobacteria bacterium]
MTSLPIPIAAFFAGIVSFLSPCVLPLVPGYVSLISGASVEELQKRENKLSRTVMLHSVMFILGFMIVFVALGAAATGVGQLVHQYKRWLTWAAGVIVIVFGLHLTGILKIKALYADKRMHAVGSGKSPLGAFLVGFAFAFGWTPCLGPVLTVLLGYAGATETVSKGVLLLGVYSLGLAVPFLLTSIAMDRFMGFYGTFRRHLHTVEVLSGVFLIIFGVLIFTRHFTVLSSYLSFLNRFSL